MKLLVVVPALGSVYGGPSKSVVELAQALGKTGISVDIITTNANGSAVVDNPVSQWIQAQHYRVQYFPYAGIGDYKLSLPMAIWLFQHVQHYDLVQVNAIFSVSNLPVYFACRWHSVPYVVIPRGMLEPWALSYKAWKKKVYYALFERPALQRAIALQMLASTEAKQIEPLQLRAPLVIAANGIHRQDFKILHTPEIFYEAFPHTRDKNILLFLGRIDPKKGLDLLAQAFGKALREYPNTHLVVAGPDNVGYLPKAKQQFEETASLKAVTFTGMLSGEMKCAALSAAQYYIAPSYSEGFSMSVLEGMASGLPCIITTGCNFPEAAQARVAHVTAIEPEAITQALLICLGDPKAAALMGARARDFVLERYTWDSIAGQLATVYGSLSKPPPKQLPDSQYA